MKTTVQIPFGDITIPAYYVTPDIPNKYPAIILIYEIWGITDHMKDVAHRLQEQGYAVLIPDVLSKTQMHDIAGDVFVQLQDPKQQHEGQKRMREALAPINSPAFAEETIAKLKTCFTYLKQQEKVNGNIGTVGFCFGGTYAFSLAAAEPNVKAAVIFYGRAPEPETLKKITCPILAFYGEQDTNLTSKLPELNETMATLHKTFLAIQYPDCGHAFFRDTDPSVYNQEAAEDAWNRLLPFLQENLS